MQIEQLFPILDRLCLQMALTDITMDVLAAKFGISRASLYRNYGSRQDILQAYLRHSQGIADFQPSADIHERILKAAQDVFFARGFAAATMEQIAEQAGLGTATLYRYVERKENLITQVLQRLAPSENNLLDLLASSEEIHTLLPQIVSAMLDFLENHPQLFKFMIFESEYLMPIRKQVDRIQDRMRDHLLHFFENQLPPGPGRQQIAQLITLSFLGMVTAFAFSDLILEDAPRQTETAVAWISTQTLNQLGGFSA